MKRRTLMKSVAAGVFASTMMTAGAAFAETTTLRLHQFLPPVATVPKHILKPWAERVEAASDGTLKIEHFDAMALGGRPPELMDQAIDGVVDMAMTVVGYTPGRYPKTEVFELPFMMTDPIATSLAFWQLVEDDLQDGEYKDLKVLGAWVHGPGVIHTKEPVTKLEDLAGKKLRGPTRVINEMLSELGATPSRPAPARHPRSAVERRGRGHRDPVGSHALHSSGRAGEQPHRIYRARSALYGDDRAGDEQGRLCRTKRSAACRDRSGIRVRPLARLPLR